MTLDRLGTDTLAARTTAPAPPAATATEPPLSVLFADDDDAIRRLVERGILEAGYKVVVARDGAEVLERADHTHFDICVVDLRMPRVDGIEVIRSLKRRWPHRPVLVLSGRYELEDKVAAFDAGADDFLEKPFFVRELLKRVEVHARHHRLAAELIRLRRVIETTSVMADEAGAVIAHDLNTGMSIVKANVEYVATHLRGAVAADPQIADVSVSLDRALQRMVRQMKAFIDVSRLEVATLRAHPSRTDVIEISRIAAETQLPRRTASEVRLVFEFPAQLVVEVDPTLLERILHNLLNNAGRHVDPGGRIRVAGSVEATAAGDVLVMRIGNSGPPISPALRDSIFAKHVRGSEEAAPTGMGLYFCRLAAEAHGGTIELCESRDLGTDFELRMPCTAHDIAATS